MESLSIPTTRRTRIIFQCVCERERERERMASTMAIRAAAVSRPSLPPKQQQVVQSSKARPVNRHSPLLSPANPASLSLLAVFSSAGGDAKAFALPKEDIVSSLTKAEETIGQAVDVGSQVLDFTQHAIKSLADALKPAVEAGLPVLQSAGEQALKVANPVVTDASKQAKDALQTAGVDPSPLFSAAKTVADAAQQTTKIIAGVKPIASTTMETIASSDPALLAVSAGALFLGYLTLPAIFSAISYSFRGYKGNLSPAQTLDLITSQNYFLIDIRSEKDKDKSGVPRLPANAKNKLIALPIEELPSKIKGIVRNPKNVEAEIVALKISFLKRVNKGSNLVIMDSYADTAKIVAKSLTSLGFKNCRIMTDGFSGGRGWMQSKLGTDNYNISFAEIISPSRVIPAAARFGTITSSRKLLPGRSES